MSSGQRSGTPSDTETSRLLQQDDDERHTRERLEQFQQADEEFVEVVRSPPHMDDPESILLLPSTARDTDATVNNEEATANRDDGPVAQLTRRLRCLFSTITWPIVPLGTILSFALLWVLYAAFVLDVRRSCSHPLHWYAFASFLFIAYAPHHPQLRSRLFSYNRERDGPVRPIPVRMYDQFFHTLCILYVYGGVTLVESCREDTGHDGAQVYDKMEAPPPPQAANTCAATCPNLYQALAIYITTLEMFAFALILPLLFLPCVYLWIIRRASAEAEAFSQFQERLEEEEALLNSGGLTAQEIIDSLEKVKLVSTDQEQVLLQPLSSTSRNVSMDGGNTRECCICMSEFVVQQQGDIETWLSYQNSSESLAEENIIVRTKCGHIFHAACLAGWIGGRWEPNRQPNQQGDEGSSSLRRFARRTCCPLCREDLKPPRRIE